MSDDANYSLSDFDYDDELLDQVAAPDSPGLAEPGRPTKRRRLSPTRTDKQDNGDGGNEELDTDSDSFNPSLPKLPKAPEKQNDVNKAAGRKLKTHTPKYLVDPEPMFVSQTQPPSSPSRIRGPRWKLPGRNTVVPPQTTKGAPKEDDFDAAIAASLQSFREEQYSRGVTESFEELRGEQDNDQAPTVPASGNTDAEQGGYDFDDIPDDAFDFEPELTKPTGNEPIVVSSQPQQVSQASRRPAGSQSTSFRQTTLFGGFASSSNKSSSQAVSRSWPLVNQNETPTHHQLNKDALRHWIYPTNLGKKREYQFNIAYRALFHNLLVALPTGLGKTLIAATVMLNWFRWTKDAQIVFVAPTKPLVSQQVEACSNIVGIPRSTTTLLTGNTPPGVRAEEWKSKRVFFMTPQTVINDLKTGIADPKRIVLLVVDEAHRATGAYSYVEIVKFIERFNKSFRVLALTATPGGTVETVQEVIDGLNISRIEIRTEQSLDIREFVHTRKVEVETFDNSEEMASSMELFSKALQPAVDKLRNMNAYWGRDPTALTPYGLTKARQEWNSSAAARATSWPVKGAINSTFTVLASLAHALDLLKYHGIGPFFRSLASFEDTVLKEKKGGKCAAQIVADGNFKTLMSRLRLWTGNEEFIGHPKLKYLREVILNHFLDSDGGSRGSSTSNTRVMIFSHFRDSAEEIVRVLKRHKPMIRPQVFVGQASTKGSTGMNQKAQGDMLAKFKAGTFNTIVATSIGEEGLDIGEVDLIVCYDGHTSPIRMLQRMGRTGRKRAGKIILLLAKGKEEETYCKAKDSYEKMQQLIASGTRFTFHDDKSPRILPGDIQPEVREERIEIPIENSQAGLPEPKKRARAPKRPPKKFHMPDDVETGFTKASRLGGAKPKRKAPSRSPSPELEEYPDLDELCANQSEELAEDLDFQAIVGKPSTFLQNIARPEPQRYLRPTKYIRHSRQTRRLVNTTRKLENMEFDYDDTYKALVDDPNQKLDLEDLSTDREDDVVPEKAVQTRQNSPDPGFLRSDSFDLEALFCQTPPPPQKELSAELEGADHTSMSPRPSQRRKRCVISDDSE